MEGIFGDKVVESQFMAPEPKKFEVQMGMKNFVINTNSDKPDNVAVRMNGRLIAFGHLEETAS